MVRRFASGASDEAFIAHLYEEMLGRPPDAGALSTGARSLGLGLLRRGRLRRAIASSAEYRSLTPLWKRSLNQVDSRIRRFVSGESDEAFIAHLYEEMLGRPPDAGALSAGARNLSLGLLRRGRLRRAIASSAEYRGLTPLWKRPLNQVDSRVRRFVSGESDEAFMERLYGELLGRRPEASALSAGRANFGRGFHRRGRLRRQIEASSEHRALTALRGIRSFLRDAPAPATARSLAASSPEEIWLELTTRCNLVPACAMCGYASAAPGPRRDMDPGTWRSLLPLLRRARIVGLHGAGEPLLYPLLGDLLEALGSSPAVAGFNSNGHLLSADSSRRLVEKKLGWISISLDAATRETYLRIRRRPDFETLLSKIRSLREIRDAGGSASPEIEINMTLMKLNLAEAPAFVDLAADLGVERVMFQEIQPGGSQRVVAPDGFVFDYREQELAGDPRRDDLVGRARERALARGLKFNCEILYGPPFHAPPEASDATEVDATSQRPACTEPWKRLLFDVHGDAFVCCVQRTNEILLGNAPRDPHEEIWNGRRARLVREAMFASPAPSCCTGCYRV